MFEKVLIALDFSRYTRNILDYASGIPGIQEVVLLHVVDASHPSRLGWTHGAQIENVKILMAEKKEALLNRGLQNVEVIVDVITGGTVPQSILEAARARESSLIVMGARGINPVQDLLLGSVSSSVIRHAGTNVLIVHPGPASDQAGASSGPSHGNPFSKVLVPTDFSIHAGDALSVVTAIPGIKELILMHVISRSGSQPGIEIAVKEAQARLSELEKECTGVGSVKIHIRVGDPTGMILSVAEEDDVSLVAMSAYGTGRLREMLLGSTTFGIVRRTKRPVLVIRAGQENHIP